MVASEACDPAILVTKQGLKSCERSLRAEPSDLNCGSKFTIWIRACAMNHHVT
jgi:hypothetical protein